MSGNESKINEDGRKEMVEKLMVLKVIRDKSKRVETLQAHGSACIESLKTEESNFEFMKQQITVLKNERRVHEQAICQIDDDLSQLKNLMELSLTAKDKAKESLRACLEQYRPLKDEVDDSRRFIGLELLPDIENP